MGMTEIRAWFNQERLRARDRLEHHLRNGRAYNNNGLHLLARNELVWAREIRNDWKFFDFHI